MKRTAAMLVALGMLAGCGEPPRPKGPALPYTPEAAKADIKEEDIPLKDDLPRVELKTSLGDVEILLFEDEAPNTVANFIKLVEEKFYDGLTFHRVESDFCIQGGDPKGDGKGGPGFRIKPEFHDVCHHNVYGTVACAKQPNLREQSGSQFFFNIKKDSKGNEQLDRQHVVFGKVVKGIGVVEKMAAVSLEGTKPKDPLKILSAKVLKKRDHPYEPQRIPAPEEKEEPKKTGAISDNRPPAIIKPMEAKTTSLPDEKPAAKTGQEAKKTVEEGKKTAESKIAPKTEEKK